MSHEPYAFGPNAHDPQAALPPAGMPQDGTPFSAAPESAVPVAAVPVTTVPVTTVPEPGAPALWGGRPPAEGRRRLSTLTKSMAAVGVAAVIAVGGTVAVTSANADNTSAAPAAVQPMGGEGTGAAAGPGGTTGTGRDGFGGAMASRSLLAGALHGEFVVSAGTGTATERLQTGSISAVSATSITVVSTDKFTATYAVPSGVDVSAVATGTTVTVLASVNGSTATVVSISAAAPGDSSTGSTGDSGV